MSKKTLKKSVMTAGENARETIATAAERVGPVYDQTRDAVLEGLGNLTENLSETLEKTDELPGSVMKHLPEAAEPVKKKHHRLLTCFGVLAVIGAIFIAVRQILLPKDDGWTPHEPSGAFGDDDVTTDFSEPAAAEPETAVEEAAEAPAEPVEETAGRDYGEGSYAGANPPEGYTIKGNERSMKFHTPDGAGYSRTNADVWFVSSEAAEAAGFTRASR
ncbi:hypothetical protein [uncultured Propionibacterium sp.]|uniref:sunset domain-containing protein n=1 Tax=uncultured Propionibacterium sp. TaxID=218066 RepID=UPI0037DC0491